MFNQIWPNPPKRLTLPNDEVHVWCASLYAPAAQVEQLREVLTDDEQQRVLRFAFAKDRRRFLVARGLLRLLLGRYLDWAPDQLRFVYNSYGKPSLSPTSNPSTLEFNLSHSGNLVLYAIARNRAVGIDLEHIRTDFAYEPIAQHFFSAHEQDTLRMVPREQQREAFFAAWTRKEAYLKARGEGLSLPLNQFDVSLSPGKPVKLLCVRGDPEEAARWTLQELKPSPGYVATLAAQGHDWRYQCWQRRD